MPFTPGSSYPAGFSHALTLRGMPTLTSFLGNVLHVNSAIGSNEGGNDGTRFKPYRTIAYALTRSAANTDDVIMVHPGHAETITSSTTLALNLAGISIIGMGTGNKRPTLTFTTANTATINVTAANVSIQNMIFIGNFLSIASCFTLNAAPEFWVDNCEFRDTSAVLGFLSIITTIVSTNCDGLTFTNNRVQSDATTTPGPAVVIANTIDRVTVSRNNVWHSVASNNISALIEHGALVVNRLVCEWNYIYSINTDTATGAILVKTTATTGSGMICHNRVRALDIAGAIMVPAAAVQYGLFDNLFIGDGTANSGFVLPAIGTDA